MASQWRWGGVQCIFWNCSLQCKYCTRFRIVICNDQNMEFIHDMPALNINSLKSLIQGVFAWSVTSWRVGHLPTHSKVVHAVGAALYKQFDTQQTSIEQRPLQNTAQIRHLPITIKQQLWAPNYDIIVALGRTAMHFLKLQFTVKVLH